MIRPFKPLWRFRGLALGFAMGLLVGSTGVAVAAFGRTGWERFGSMFKQGYVAGFIDCVQIAKQLDPLGYIATQFPAPPRAKPIVWVRAVDELYAEEEHKNRTLAQVLIIAGAKLEKSFGEGTTRPSGRQLEQLRNAIDRQRKALLDAKRSVETAQDELKKDEGTDAGDDKAAATAEGAGEETPPTPEGAPEEMPEGSHGQGMLPEGSHPDEPIKHPQADPGAPNKNEQDQQE